MDRPGPLASVFEEPNAVQIRIALDGIEPEVWRRLVVPLKWNLEQLHLGIQAAFNWWNYHLHEFRIGGLRYGEGTIYYKNGTKQRIYWQGPSVGFDFGANGSRSLVLVYNSTSPEDLYTRFGGVEGSAYFVGGLGVNFQAKDDIVLAPIRTGVGARLGANVGYLKYSGRPNWNPF